MLLWYSIFLVNVALSVGNEKIFGGRYAKEGEFPFVVAIRGKLLCAGALVTMSKVVTAAHCFKLDQNGQVENINLNETWVTAGSVDIENLSDEYDERKIERISVPHGYKVGSRFGGRLDSHDVGLAFLNNPFYVGRKLQVLKIVSRNKAIFKQKWDELVAKRTICYAMGWGATVFSLNDAGEEVVSNPSPKLKVIEVRPLSNRSCQAVYKAEDDMTVYGEVCVDSVKRAESICDGDSGGPLVCDGLSYAILNHGPRCGTTYYPQGYVLFWYYLEFLGLASSSSIPKFHRFLIFFPVLNNYI
ncbi:chymotrypsin-1-like [Cimex lectularius]|uniref:Peptidase S1 domain-containing protein n=1 Tax=Cimex lectularius TaxID=79782 RepID=A0A8I6THE3_CIMLE|nr:chymotrypsin-1-like [Cimex lectularius]